MANIARNILGLVAAALSITGTALAQAPAYPTKPVRIVVPYAPGGSTDIVARIVGEQMRQILGQAFVVENKPGANGLIAIEEMLRSKGDGYTIMVGNVTTNTIMPVVDAKKLKFDYEKEVVAVQKLADLPHFLLATTVNFAPATFSEFIDYAKKNPGKLRYGTVGAGSYPHYDMAYLARRVGGLDMIAIHNKAGATGVINDMVTGDTQVAFLNSASTASMVKAGKLRALAVVNSKRLDEYPQVPTMSEVGYADVGTAAWNSMFAPSATPRPILEALFKASADALAAPSVVDALKKQNYNIIAAKSLDEAKSWLSAEMAQWRKITSQVKVEAAE